MDATKLQNDFDSLRRLHEATNKVLDQITRENMALKDEVRLMRTQISNANNHVDANNGILQHSINSSNKQVEDCLTEINSLKARLRKYETVD